MKLNEIGEFGLIELIKDSFSAPADVLGIGDDCAVLPQKSGMETLVSTDMLMEGSHFLIGDVPARRLGWKSAAVNISDIAAMGGRPIGTFLSMAIPDSIDNAWIQEFIAGYKEISDKYSCPLLGGDTTSSPDRLCINVTVTGDCPAGRSLKRSGARDGDLICVTGPLGDSATGLKLILGSCLRDTDAQYLIDRHYLPVPRVSEGMKLAATDGVHAMMDISDGIGSDLQHILDASGVGAVVDVKAVPKSAQMQKVCTRNGWDADRLAICGGEDYELLFTVSAETEKYLEVPHHVIGRISSAPGLIWEGGSGAYSGFKHF